MSNIYLKVTTEKNWCSQNFDFLSLKNVSPGQFLGSSNSHRSPNFKTSCCNLKMMDLGAKLCVAFLLFYQLKSPCFLLKTNINFNKNKTELKMENPT